MKTTRNLSFSLSEAERDTGKNKTRLIVLFLMIFLSVTAISETYGQGVGISELEITPDASSILELRSTDRGFLAPRMTTAQRIAITSPAQGLLVFDTTTNSFWYYNSVWKELASVQTSAPIQTDAENYLSGDVMLPTDRSYSNALTSITLEAGTWMITSETTIVYTGTNETWNATVVLGTANMVEVYTSGQSSATSLGIFPEVSAITISLSKIVTLTTSTIVSTFAAASFSPTAPVPATVVNMPPTIPSTPGTATAIHAIRIK